MLARGAWLALFVCLLLAGLAYPLLGTAQPALGQRTCLAGGPPLAR
jgi:hypothetical protein